MVNNQDIAQGNVFWVTTYSWIAMNNACDDLKLCSLNQLTIIMQRLTIVVATFIFGGPSNLSQNSTT